MTDGYGDMKMNQIGTIRLNCDAFSIPTISFDPRPLGKFLHGLEGGEFS